MTRAEAAEFVAAIVKMRDNATDEQALQAASVYSRWRSGTAYTEGSRIQHKGILYKCRQAHTSQDDWEPHLTPAMWVAISLEDGTLDKPIPAVRGMEYAQDKHYLDAADGKTYLCTRSGVLQYLPHELVGHYFDIVEEGS